MLSTDSTLLHRVPHNYLDIDYCQLDALRLYPHVFKAGILSTQRQISYFEIWSCSIYVLRMGLFGAFQSFLNIYPVWILQKQFGFRRVRNLRRATTSFAMSVLQSVCPCICSHWTVVSHWTDFHETCYLSIFRTNCGENSSFIKSAKNNGHFTCRPIYIFDHISLSSS